MAETRSAPKPRLPGTGRGFTLIEFLIGSVTMLAVILIMLAVYAKSNKISVDQQAYTEMQHDVRSSLYLAARDVRMAGIGMAAEFMGFYIGGVDNDATDTAAGVTPDRLTLIGNIEDPLNLRILSYQGSSTNVNLFDYSFEQNPYGDSDYDNRVIAILPNPASQCRSAEIRTVTHVTHDTGATNEKLNFLPGLAPGINPPGGLSGTCSSSSDYVGGTVMFVDIKEYWLDVTGNYPGLTAGQNGYIGNGNGNVLYCTTNGVFYPIAQNIENLQFQYNGDLDANGSLDGYQNWNSLWTGAEVGRIRMVRIMVLGKTRNRFMSVSGTAPSDLHLYRRPAVANTAAAGADDLCRRFLMESTANVRNMSLNLYSLGER